eukprot:scaffold317502_cov15-Tisochrysis_lutea.AAC.1
MLELFVWSWTRCDAPRKSYIGPRAPVQGKRAPCRVLRESAPEATGSALRQQEGWCKAFNCLFAAGAQGVLKGLQAQVLNALFAASAQGRHWLEF